MTFEEALYFELNSITELNGNIYPIHAIEGEEGPFMTYYKDDVNYPINLNGPSNIVEGTYVLDILHPSYKEVQTLFKLVKDKLISFLGRNIGQNGPLIQMISINNVRDLYEQELDYNRLNFNIEVKYKEV
ncbi:hypothetical protein HPK19_07480 [Arthrobacter citreus]|nr:hypothetical protein HPK19_07480 [Arthrobacter citreus]